MADSEQAVETALLILNQEINKLQGVRKVTDSAFLFLGG